MQRAHARARVQPLQELAVVVADAQRHQAPKGLASVGLGDAEMPFALDEAGDEVAFSG